MTREFDATDWHAAVNGTHGAPWFVTRTLCDDRGSLRSEYHTRDGLLLRRFKTREAAQKVADRLNITADYNTAREHARLAAHYLIRATDHLRPTSRDAKALLPLLESVSDVYQALTGIQL